MIKAKKRSSTVTTCARLLRLPGVLTNLDDVELSINNITQENENVKPLHPVFNHTRSKTCLSF